MGLGETSEGGDSPGRQLDRLIDGLDYPMFVVTTSHGDERAGCLVGFTTQASLDPPRLLVCLSVKNRTHRVARLASTLAVHRLRPDQHDLAALFGATTGDDVDKFSRCRWRQSVGGAPVLVDSPRWMVGTILERLDLGDHVGYLLEPVDSQASDDAPAMSFQQTRALSPGHPA